MSQSQSLKSLGAAIVIVLSASIFPSAIANAQAVIKIDGSSTVYPITHNAASQFQVERKNAVNITVNVSGSGDGFKKFCRGEIDIVNASRPILKSEMKDCQKAHVQYVEIPVAFDALTVAVNPENTW
ncbi:MAG: substrate-binding domain-containing protein, partial [Proteobacteria bacterium]|nr:substrate-binding domain-containing protein [Pseudomonadota bacterium]